ncbi:hypothetical protein BJ322DRAFT_1097464 [Thelephora terrestris]|uniref:Bacteriophage T5 Orf172 DNA-binding domain-containing protein n=1 Tax=Thelephora terrestris TaxID=56493 RepID=A0A9P6HPX3_9AGAM|nr:hypothetical protein BJ322DRAFT_1097464 [Thelephora terrestris]
MRYAQGDPRPPVPPKDFPRRPPMNPNTLLQEDRSALNHAPHQIRPSSDTSLPRPFPASQPSTPAKPGASPRPIEKRERRSSEPTSPSDEKIVQLEAQCSAQTKTGKRCTRVVKVGPPLAIVHPDAKDVERFCFQHEKNGLNWIPSYLNTDTQAALRSEMSKLPSAADVAGYIYTFEIRDESDPDHIHLKVGRAVNLTKRLDQWDKQCGTKQREHIIRGWWPGTVEASNDVVNGGSLLKGKVVAGDKGAYCHRLERLIHLELGDLVLSRQYINPAFPKLDADDVKKTGLVTKQKCAECGTTHKEIFTFKKVRKGKFKGQEWESIVQPVIQKWGGYVAKYPQRPVTKG